MIQKKNLTVDPEGFFHFHGSSDLMDDIKEMYGFDLEDQKLLEIIWKYGKVLSLNSFKTWKSMNFYPDAWRLSIELDR